MSQNRTEGGAEIKKLLYAVPFAERPELTARQALRANARLADHLGG